MQITLQITHALNRSKELNGGISFDVILVQDKCPTQF